MNTKAKDKKTITNPTNGRNNQTNSAKTKISIYNFNNISAWKDQNSTNNKNIKTHTNNNSISNLDVSNGKTSFKVSPFLSNNLNSADESDLASFSLNLVTSNENVFPKIFNKINEDEIYSSNREEFNEIILDFMKNKLESLNSIINNKNPVNPDTNCFSSSSQDMTIISKIVENLDDPNVYENNSNMSNNLDYEDTYKPFTNLEREKILNEIELNAESRQAKYQNLFNKMKLEFREIISLADADLNEIYDETENEEIKDLNQFLSTMNNINDKITNLDTIQIDKQDNDLLLASYNYCTNLVITENDNDLNSTSVLNTEGEINDTLQQSYHTNDIKKRLNNLKSASRSNLLLKSQNNNKITTAEKLNVVKKMGNANPGKKKTSINRGAAAKKIQESENLNKTALNNTTINPNNLSNTQNSTQVKSTKQLGNEKRKKRVSNGATESAAAKDHLEQIHPRKRFNTQARQKSKANLQDLSTKKEEDESILKCNSIIQNKQTIVSTNSDEISEIKILKYNTNTNLPANIKKNTKTTISQTNENENILNSADGILKSNSVMIVNSKQVSDPNLNSSLTNNYTNNPDLNFSKNEEAVEEFVIDLNSLPKVNENPHEDIKIRFKNIVLKEYNSDNNFNLNGSKCPDKLSLTKNLKINTIDSVPYQDISDDEILDSLNYYTVNDESVLHKFPVLSINTNHMTNDSLMARNKRVKTDKILIHAGSGKRIKPETRLETMDNKENTEDVGPCSICRSRCAIL